MPRFLFETRTSTASKIDAALSIVAARFPEIEVEHRYLGRGSTQHELWVCTAPSASHVTRWAAAAQLQLDAVDQVDDEPYTAYAFPRSAGAIERGITSDLDPDIDHNTNKETEQ